jgi:GT2 family glycosyltransferase
MKDLLLRFFQVLRQEGQICAFRALFRYLLRKVGLYPELTLKKALNEMELIWPNGLQNQTISSSQNQPFVSVVILTYNNLNFTRLCLRSIYSVSSQFPYEIIVVDNASVDGTQEFLRDYSVNHKNFKYVLNSENRGFSKGNNQGVSISSGQVVIFLNNDTIVTPGWIDKFCFYLRDPKIGMIGPMTNFWGNESRIDIHYHSLKGLLSEAQKLETTFYRQVFDIDMLALFCGAIRKEVITDIGPLDEQFGAGMFEDDDYSYRLKKAGYRVVCARDVFIHHWGKASFSRLEKKNYEALFLENKSKFEKKWNTKWRPPNVI